MGTGHREGTPAQVEARPSRPQRPYVIIALNPSEICCDQVPQEENQQEKCRRLKKQEWDSGEKTAW